MAVFLLIILVAVALGIVGAVVKGLFWLLIIGIVVFLLSFVFAGARLRGGRSRRITR
ncbi:MAG: hypothetical protein ACR2LF_04440 [Jatrophihabitantaceae bacterium]